MCFGYFPFQLKKTFETSSLENLNFGFFSLLSFVKKSVTLHFSLKNPNKYLRIAQQNTYLVFSYFGVKRNTIMYKGAHRGKNQPMPLRGIKAFCYRVPKVCPDFQGGAKNN